MIIKNQFFKIVHAIINSFILLEFIIKKFFCFTLCFTFIFVLISCNENNLQITENSEVYSHNQKISLITSNAEKLISQNEILSNLNKSGRSVTVAIDTSHIFTDSELSDDDIKELTYFSSSPSSYITENINFYETTSDENLNLIYSIYNEATVDEVISNMESVNSEMAEDYKKSISEFYNNLDLLLVV